jgi:hypothetical protein
VTKTIDSAHRDVAHSAAVIPPGLPTRPPLPMRWLVLAPHSSPLQIPGRWSL